MKILIYGGAFDPVHMGHLSVADNAQTMFGYDRVLFVPCYSSMYGKKMASFTSRWEMLTRAINDYKNPTFLVSAAEREHPIEGKTYTLLEYLKVKFRDINAQMDILIGSDTLKHIQNWYEFEKINDEYVFIVMERYGYPIESKVLKRAFYASFHNDFEISSTTTRHQLKTVGTSSLVPQTVEKYIKENNLYI
jgi:nicotinate-nucleotide adenylyltransferase